MDKIEIALDAFAEARRVYEEMRGWHLAVAFFPLDRGDNPGLERVATTHFGSRTVLLDRGYVEKADVADLLDTVFHEIAHVVAGRDAGHGPEWIRVAESFGLDVGEYKLANALQKISPNLDYNACLLAAHLIIEDLSWCMPRPEEGSR